MTSCAIYVNRITRIAPRPPEGHFLSGVQCLLIKVIVTTCLKQKISSLTLLYGVFFRKKTLNETISRWFKMYN